MTTGNDFSGLFAPIYVCPEHGETWHAESVEEIDSVNDEVYAWHKCPKCHREVKLLVHDGHPAMHPLTAEEAYWETWSEDNDEEEDDYGTCPTCGGEFWDGGTSCTCNDEDNDNE
jgi:uncharacterized protein with PIN domain